MLRPLVVALVLSLLIAPPAFAATAAVPARLTDVFGADVDVAAIAARTTLIFVTMKTPTCPVCSEQLRRLGALNERLRACGASFIVLAPGPADALRRVAASSGFPYPFVADVDLAVARAAELAVGPAEIMPGFFHVDQNRRIVWTQRGRSAGAFGDGELVAHLRCGRAGDLVAGADRPSHGTSPRIG